MANHAKDNFNQAMFSMFGVGKDTSEPAPKDSTPPAPPAPPAAPTAPVPPVTPPPSTTYIPPQTSKPRTYIAEGTVLEGNLRSSGDVEIAGTLKGNLEAEGQVSVYSALNGNITAESLNVKNCTVTGDIHVSDQVLLDEQSCIIGNVFANEFICSGQVKGHLNIDKNLALRETAIVEGNIATGTMEMASGAILSGKVEMNIPKRKNEA